MVERPIKKSERAASAPTQASESPSGERSRDHKKGKGRGEGNRGDRAEKPPANPALMRGPRPAKAKPIAAEPEAVVEELPSATDDLEAEVTVDTPPSEIEA